MGSAQTPKMQAGGHGAPARIMAGDEVQGPSLPSAHDRTLNKQLTPWGLKKREE